MYTLKKTRSIIPQGVKVIPWEEGAYLCVSINNNRTKDKQSLKEIWGWIKESANEVMVLVGDYLHRKNIMISKGLSESVAIKEATMLGKSRILLLKETAEEQGLSVWFKSTKDFNDLPSFKSRYERVNNYISHEKRLKALVEKTISDFLSRQMHITMDAESARHLCYEYLIEELTIFEYLAEDEKLINIYPGSHLQITKRIVNGQFGSISPYLTKMILFELIFKPKK